MVAIVVLQILLVAGIMTFEQQFGWVTFAMLVVVGAWLATVAYLARAEGYPPVSVIMSVLAWTYVGYPVAAFWLGRHLVAGLTNAPQGENA